MLNQSQPSMEQNNFTPIWLIIGALVVTQIIYIVLCQIMGAEIQQAIDPEQRILIRTVFYVIAIATFPLTTLIRHIFVRLNQTMPGNKPAHQRYLVTVIVSQAMMESIGIFGFVMFILGDDFNTLYIFSGLAILGFFLQRPKQDEYLAIAEALENHS